MKPATTKRFVMLVIGALLFGYALVTLGAYVAQRRLVFPARGTGRQPVLAAEPRSPERKDEPTVAEATIVKVAGTSGRAVHALYVKAREGAPTVVHFHGNGEELADLDDFVELFRARGFGVLAVEYPGYGLSKPGEPSERALYEDAETALRDLLENKGVSRECTVLSGQSLGTGVAVEMARRGYGARVVLYSPYTSIVDVANVYLPFLPNRLLVKDRFDSASKAPSIDAPVLVVHGTRDEVIPFALGQELTSLFPNARLVTLDGGHHNDLFVRGGAPLADDVAAFCRGQ